MLNGMAPGDQPVLVAFANQAGSTAGIATELAAVLRRAGLAVDCRIAGDVTDVSTYRAVILGSGVFVSSRRSDGGGFLARHEAGLARRPVWLFCAGPIGGGRCTLDASGAMVDVCSVSSVAAAVGARGSAVFGPIAMPEGTDPIDRLGTVDHQRVRAWAGEIAAELLGGGRVATLAPAKPRRGVHRCGQVAATG